MSERASQKLRLLDLLLNEQGINAPARQGIPRRADQSAAPLSSAQKRLWFLNHIEPGPHYNDHFNLRLKGPLNVGVLQRCLTEISNRHETLRSRFVIERGEPIQRICPPAPVALPVTDLSALPEPERSRKAMSIAIEEARTPFNLQTESSFRARLLRFSDDDYLLLQTWHHIGTDGWSRGIFLRELTTLYPALLAGRPSPLPPLQIQYADFAAWQEQWLRDKVSAGQLAYWKKQLTGAPALLEWPTDFPRPEVQSYRGARLPIQLSKSLTDALTELSRREGCTLFMTLFAAFQTLASRYTRQEDILVGTPIANRNRPEIEGLIGEFVNTLVLRTNLSGNPTFRQVLAQVRETALAAYANQDLPFERVVEELHPARSQSYNPIFQVMFVLQNTPAPSLKIRDVRASVDTARDLPSSLSPREGREPERGASISPAWWNGLRCEPSVAARHVPPPSHPLSGREGEATSDLTIEPFEIDSGIAKFDLMFNLEETAAGLHGWVEFATDLFRPQTVSRLIGHYQTLLKAIALNPEHAIGTLPILTETERAQILVSWNDTQAEYPHERCFHELFEDQAARMPDATALVFHGQNLTYEQLNRRANRLAHHLRSLGLGPDKLVGLCVERSLEMVIGLLAILKSGAAYLPLDPAFPAERLAFILQDANVPVLLTQEALLGSLPRPQGIGPHLETAHDCPSSLSPSEGRAGREPEREVFSSPTWWNGSRYEPGVAARHVPPGAAARHVPPGAAARHVPPGAAARHVPPGVAARHVPPPSPPLRGREGDSGSRVICIDAEMSAFQGESEFDLPSQSMPEDLAYVLYTSGSTGKPKGVQIPHRALVNFLCSMAREPGFAASDVLLAVTTTSFDIAGLELWLPLMAGGTVVIADNETARSGKKLAEELDRCGATMLQATPMTWRLLLESGWRGRTRLKALCGGEAWGTDLAEALLPKCASLWNMYGPTETTIWSAATRVKKGEPPSIGKPIANTQFYVLDSRLQPVPFGVPGELHIGGDGLARGYLNRPELTSEKFVADPFSTNPAGMRVAVETDIEAPAMRTPSLPRSGGEGRGEEDPYAKTHDLVGEIKSPLSGSMASQARHQSVSPDKLNASRYVVPTRPSRGEREDGHSTAAAIAGARLYKTGDLVRQLDSGKIEFLGRLDHQVKLRGFRVELGEIEAVLRSHPDVRDSAVAVREGSSGDKRLVAYVVARQQPAPAPTELQSLVADQLPGYMVPTAFVTLDALPLTPNGKVDRKALPEPEKTAAVSANHIAPGTPMEKTIAKIWSDVLRLEKVSVHDNFFDIGGHSLLLARVLAQLCEALHTDVSIVKLFQHPTISSLAAHLAQPAKQPVSLAAAQRRAELQRAAMGRRPQPAKATV